MLEARNIELIKTAYSAFAQGDVQVLLNAVSDDLDFHPLIPQAIWQFAGPRRGKTRFVEFLEGFAEVVLIERFEPLEFIAQGASVVVWLSERARIKATGIIVDQTYIHIFKIANNQIVRLDIFGDSAPVRTALEAVKSQ
jgi:uncharacterized protein